MTQIKKILESLEKSQRKSIMYAFENEVSYTIRLSDNEYLSVHSETRSDQQEITREGFWSYGKFT